MRLCHISFKDNLCCYDHWKYLKDASFIFFKFRFFLISCLYLFVFYDDFNHIWCNIYWKHILNTLICSFLYLWKNESCNELISKHTPAVFISSEKGLRVVEETVFAKLISPDGFLQLKGVGVWTLTLSMQLPWVATK